MSSQLSVIGDPELTAELAPEHEAAGDLEETHDDEPAAEPLGWLPPICGSR